MSTFDAISKSTPLAQTKVSVPVTAPATTQAQAPAKPIESKPDIIYFISKKAIDPKDVNDTVTMPRAIFKGYMCFTAGTAINAIGGMLKNPKAKKALGIAGTLISIVGTFNFVKPFLYKETEKPADKK
jgi:hypothetical protein